MFVLKINFVPSLVHNKTIVGPQLLIEKLCKNKNKFVCGTSFRPHSWFSRNS